MCEKASDQREICRDVFSSRRGGGGYSPQRDAKSGYSGGALRPQEVRRVRRESRDRAEGCRPEPSPSSGTRRAKQQEKTTKTKRRKAKITTNKQKEYEAGNR